MTVKMLTAWNGYPKDYIGSVISPSEEARLVGIGFASYDLDGVDNDNVRMPVTAVSNPLTGGIKLNGFTLKEFTVPVIAFAGDSITADAKNTPTTTNWGWVTHFARMVAGRATVIPDNIFAVASMGVAHLNATQVPQVIASGAAYCCVKIGTNDVGSVDIIAGLDASYASLLAAGICVVASPILPHSTPNSFSATNKKIVDAANRWIFDKAQRTPGVIYAPTLKYITDYATGDAAATMLRDGIHTSPTGAYAVARGFADAFDAVLMPSQLSPTVDQTSYDGVTNPYGNFLANGLMIGTSGTKVNGATGSVPASWSGQRSSPASTVTAAFSKGSVAGFTGLDSSIVTVGGTGDASYAAIETIAFSLPAEIVAGDIVIATAKVKWAGLAGCLGIYGLLRVKNGAAANIDCYDGQTNPGNGSFLVTDGEATLQMRMAMPSGANTPSVRIGAVFATGAAVAGTIEFSFADLRKARI